jgi:3D (Asp-Asp-Asp) domain-containing protein
VKNLSVLLLIVVILFPKTVSAQMKDGNIGEEFQVTFYNDYGTTFSGAVTEEGITCAVDPLTVKLGSWLWLYMPDGNETYCKAQDTGSAVIGKVIDIYMPLSDEELLEMGRIHSVIVEVLGGDSN